MFMFFFSNYFLFFFLFVRSLDDELPHTRRSRSPTRYYDPARGRHQEEEYLDDRYVCVYVFVFVFVVSL